MAKMVIEFEYLNGDDERDIGNLEIEKDKVSTKLVFRTEQNSNKMSITVDELKSLIQHLSKLDIKL